MVGVKTRKKKRIDLLLVEKDFFSSREQAQRAVMAGLVIYNNRQIKKCGTFVDPEGILEVKGDSCPYVSRGGLKLEAVLQQFGINVKNKVALDAGASTGGFTQCLLRWGAKRVYAVDVGYGQLAWELRQDPRVHVKDRTNIRYLKPEDLKEKIDLITLDLSFISLKKVLPVVKRFLNVEGEILALVKPQFEAGRKYVGKGGIVKDPKVHVEVLERILTLAQDLGFQIHGITYSPLLGTNGNIEFFFWLCLSNKEFFRKPSISAVHQVVQSAHTRFLVT